MNLISPLIFGCAVYWMVGLNPQADRFFNFLVLLLLTGFGAIGVGMMVASAAPSATVAQAFAPIIMVLMILFGGFYINIDSLPDAIAWIQCAFLPLFHLPLLIALIELKAHQRARAEPYSSLSSLPGLSQHYLHLPLSLTSPALLLSFLPLGCV